MRQGQRTRLVESGENDQLAHESFRAGPGSTEWRLPDLRAVVLHVITETACHAGHLDAARELLDGRTLT